MLKNPDNIQSVMNDPDKKNDTSSFRKFSHIDRVCFNLILLFKNNPNFIVISIANHFDNF